MFSFEFCEISKNTFFTEHLRATASALTSNLQMSMYNLEKLSFRRSCEDAQTLSPLTKEYQRLNTFRSIFHIFPEKIKN